MKGKHSREKIFDRHDSVDGFFYRQPRLRPREKFFVDVNDFALNTP